MEDAGSIAISYLTWQFSPKASQAYDRPRTLLILFHVWLDLEGTMKSTASLPASQWLPQWVTVCWTVSAPTVMETEPKRSRKAQRQDMILRPLPPGRTQRYLRIRLLFIYALIPVACLLFQTAAAKLAALAGASYPNEQVAYWLYARFHKQIRL